MVEVNVPFAESPATAPAVLREILRTPAFRELIRIRLEPADGDSGREMVQTLIQEHVELPLQLAGCAPAALNTAINAAAELGQYLAGLPEPLLRVYLDDLVAELDTDSLRELPQTWAPFLVGSLPFALRVLTEATEGLARSLTRMDPQRLAELTHTIIKGLDGRRLGAAINALCALALQADQNRSADGHGSAALGQFVETIDSGKLRKAVAALSAMGRDTALATLDHVMADPVAMANAVVALPPLINDGLAVVVGWLERLDVPKEVLASTALRLLGDLDGQQLGRLLTGAARAIHTIHTGSLILGGTEPAFRATAADLLDELLQTVDGVAVGQAVIALGEDGETLAAVVAHWLRSDPAVLGGWTHTTAHTVAPVLRGAAAVLREVNAQSDEVLAATAQVWVDGVQARDLARLLNETLALTARMQKLRPDGASLSQVVAGLDLYQLHIVVTTLAAQLTASCAEHPQLRHHLEPRALGQRVNTLLQGFNRSMDRGLFNRPLAELVEAVDPDELEQAWRHVIRLASSTMLSNARRVRAIYRPLLELGFESVVLVARASRDELKRRPAGRWRIPWIGSNR